MNSRPRPQWSTLLGFARESVNLSQESLAELSGVSLGSIKAYEQGRRHASRVQLVALLDAMSVSLAIRNEVLVSAGFAANPRGLPIGPAERALTRSAAIAEVMTAKWPAFLCSEKGEILEANVPGKMLWRIEPCGSLFQLGDPAVCVATNPEIASRIVNWEEAVGQQIAAWKSHVISESLDAPSPHFQKVLDRLQQGDPALVARFVDLWDRTPPGYPVGRRWSYRIVWDEPPYGRMNFRCFAWSVNEQDGLDIDDWIPQDAASWMVLERLIGHARD